MDNNELTRQLREKEITRKEYARKVNEQARKAYEELPSQRMKDMTDTKQKEITQAVRDTFPQQPTLRDQFAMAALTGAIQDPEFEHMRYSDLASHCYMAADAMLEARENKTD